jgi:hypothetical protein
MVKDQARWSLITLLMTFACARNKVKPLIRFNKALDASIAYASSKQENFIRPKPLSGDKPKLNRVVNV